MADPVPKREDNVELEIKSVLLWPPIPWPRVYGLGRLVAPAPSGLVGAEGECWIRVGYGLTPWHRDFEGTFRLVKPNWITMRCGPQRRRRRKPARKPILPRLVFGA